MGVIVVVAGIVALAGAGPEPLDPTTPQGTAQRYAQAVLDNDRAAIEALMISENCQNQGQFFGDDTVRVRLVDTRVTGDRATVDIEISHSGGGPLSGYDYREQAQIFLEQTDAGWGVADNSWPYFFCEAPK